MNVFLRKSGATVAAALLASSCAASLPSGSTGAHGEPAGNSTGMPGTVMIPVTLPALPDRGVQYAYDHNYINTVEVRLVDSLGHETVQTVARNSYLAQSNVGGTINVLIHNVMPGTCALTVRTSHERLLASPGRASYDSRADVFFADANSSGAFDPGEKEYRLVLKSGSTVANSNFLVFAHDSDLASWAFPDNIRQDSSTVAAGFGIGGATQSIQAGTTTSIAVTVGQPPRWPAEMLASTRHVTAGASLSLPLSGFSDLRESDGVLVAHPTVTISQGIVDPAHYVGSLLNVYPLTIDASAGTVVFRPTQATHPSADDAPAARAMRLARGQAVSEMGGVGPSIPQIIVHPALVNDQASRIYGIVSHVANGTPTPIRYDLRDAFGNRVAGNLGGLNGVSLANVTMENAALTMDYAVVAHTYSPNPWSNLSPFILPDRTTGTVNAAGVYTQGKTAARATPQAADYTPSNPEVSLMELVVPYHIYEGNKAAFDAALPHTYMLNVATEPGNLNARWVSLSLSGGPVIASSSVPVGVGPRSFSLNQILPDPAGSPVAMPANRNGAVTVEITENVNVTALNNTTFTVTNYGARAIGERDTVRARVLNSNTPLFTRDVIYSWTN